MKLKISIPRVLMIVLLGILLNACKKDQQISVKQQPAPALTIQEARSWLESNDPKIMLGDRWNSTAFINEEDGHKVIKVKVNESLKDSIWTLRDILIQRNNTGDIEAVGYEVQVANSYFFTKKGAELPGANKREFIDNADFTFLNDHAFDYYKWINNR